MTNNSNKEPFHYSLFSSLIRVNQSTKNESITNQPPTYLPYQNPKVSGNSENAVDRVASKQFLLRSAIHPIDIRRTCQHGRTPIVSLDIFFTRCDSSCGYYYLFSQRHSNGNSFEYFRDNSSPIVGTSLV